MAPGTLHSKWRGRDNELNEIQRKIKVEKEDKEHVGASVLEGILREGLTEKCLEQRPEGGEGAILCLNS